MNTDLMEWVVKQKAGGGIGKAILMLLSYHANEKGEATIQIKQLAAETGCSRNSVVNWLRHFEQKGLLKKRPIGRWGERKLLISLMMERAA